MSRVITNISGKEVKDSTGRPTLKIVISSEKYSAEVLVPSGQSRGSREAKELRDQDGGMSGALEVLDSVIAPALVGKVPEQKEIDEILLALDGTSDKSKLGGNTMIGVSLASARLFAKEEGEPLWQYLAKLSGRTPALPSLFMNVINGGAHANFRLPFQEHMLILKEDTARHSFELGKDIFRRLGEKVQEKYKGVLIGDEGGYSPRCDELEEPFELLKQATRETLVSFAIDAAASLLFKDNSYRLLGKEYSKEEMHTLYKHLVDNYQIASIEDPFEESDIKNFKIIVEELGDSVDIVGDDLTVTSPERLKEIIEHKAVTAVIIKPNQIGTLSEVLETIKVAEEAHLRTIVSHRSGDTVDSFVADLAVGVGAYGLKAGSPKPIERRSKYERLIEIEEQEMVR